MASAKLRKVKPPLYATRRAMRAESNANKSLESVRKVGAYENKVQGIAMKRLNAREGKPFLGGSGAAEQEARLTRSLATKLGETGRIGANIVKRSTKAVKTAARVGTKIAGEGIKADVGLAMELVNPDLFRTRRIGESKKRGPKA